MPEHDWLAERFEEQRPHLRAVAFRMLTTIVARVCVNMLRSRRACP